MFRHFQDWLIRRPSILRAWPLMLLSGFSAHAAELKPFTSDGCSGFPEGTRQQKTLWLECCTAHDHAYWKGGTQAQRITADEQLRHCVARAGEPEIARLMLAAVRVGGSPLWPTGFRWGYGWSYPRGYGPLTGQEIERVKQMEIFPQLPPGAPMPQP